MKRSPDQYPETSAGPAYLSAANGVAVFDAPAQPTAEWAGGFGSTSHWRPLAESTRNIFSTPEWMATWWRHFGRDGEPLLLEYRGATHELRGILPLYVWRKSPVPVLRFIGHHVGDQLGPICGAQDREAAAELLLEVVSERQAILLGEHLSVEEEWRAHLGGRVLARDPSPVQRFRVRSWDEYLVGRSRNFRQTLGRRERALARQHDVRFRLTDETTFAEDLQTLFSLHAKRWAQSTGFLRFQAFHRDFAARALENGWLRLWILDIDEQPRAAVYGFRFAGVESFYQSGRDELFDRYSVGLLLLAHCVKEALHDGMEEYRFLRGGETYKYRLANEDHPVETVAVGGGTLARATIAALDLARRSRRVKSLLYREPKTRALSRP